MTRIMHVITTLGPAGAETMLCRIAPEMDARRFENEIVSLTGILDLAERMRRMGVPVRTLGMKKSVPNPLLVMRLAQWIRKSRPDVIHTWMYHANLVGAMAARLAGHVPVVWAIHHNSLDPRVDKRRTLIVNRACAFLSWKIPARIVCCSEASLLHHKELGYAPDKLEAIPNGVNLEQFMPDPAARVSLRDELGLTGDAILIGLAARFHPHKDHHNFIRAAALLHEQKPEVHFVLCGLHITWQNAQLASWIDAAGLRGCCHLLGVRQDVPRFFAAIDIATTASRNEAFPIVIGEAMACETPCVVTDVGDSARIVGRTGLVVAPGDPDALASAWRKLIVAGPKVRRRLGRAARRRVAEHFAISTIVERYQAIYSQLVTRKLRGERSPNVSSVCSVDPQ
ncbi:MAG TPA: glycosyltransferase [Candidatus Acidoferrales bacterium]|nr:glycosyltransferase [Candidatus Acidoferrales bacterium]